MRCQGEDRFANLRYNNIKKIMENEDPLWSKVACRMLLNVITHPIDYAKVLIQIGHEPIPPKPTVRLFGQPALGLPNIFQYVKHIKSVDGLSGCYRGLLPKLCSNAVYTFACDKTVKKIQFESDCNVDEVPVDDLDDLERDKRYIQEFWRNLTGQVVAIILSHPFDVISVRMMAQFVGRETKYVTIFGSVVEIYKKEGISGYFSGIIPRIIAHATSLVIVMTTTYAVNKHIIRDQDLRLYASNFISFIASTITYPFHVVSQCMIVNNSGLVAGDPPLMPIYVDWLDCWRQLSRRNQLKRGSSLLYRYYTGQYVIINGKPIIDASY